MAVSRNRRRLLTAGVLAVVVAVAAVLLLRPSGSTSTAAPGTTAPLWQSKDLDGHEVALSDYRGKVVLLNFWASWCEPCRAEFPVLRGLAAASDVVILGVVFNDGETTARSFLQSEGATWPGIIDPRAQIATAYDVHAKPGIPVSVVIDGTGRIRGRHLGPLNTPADASALIALARR